MYIVKEKKNKAAEQARKEREKNAAERAAKVAGNRERNRQLAQERARREAAQKAARQVEETKKHQEEERETVQRSERKNELQGRRTHMNELLNEFIAKCKDINQKQTTFNQEFVQYVLDGKHSEGVWGETMDFNFWKAVLEKQKISLLPPEISAYATKKEQSELGENLNNWIKLHPNNFSGSKATRESYVWDLFINIADDFFHGEDTPYTGPISNEDAYEDEEQDYVTKYSGKVDDDEEMENMDRTFLERFYRHIHSANATFHSNMAYAVNKYVKATVKIEDGMTTEEKDDRIQMRREILKIMGLHSYPACLPDTIQAKFTGWVEAAVSTALKNERYEIPHDLYNDHEAIAVFKSIVDITRKSFLKKKKWVVVGLDPDAKPIIHLPKQPILWGSKISPISYHRYLVDSSVPAPVLNTALRGSRRWLISENVNW